MRSAIVAGSAAFAILLGMVPGNAEAQRVVIISQAARPVAVRGGYVDRNARPRMIAVVRLDTPDRGRAGQGWWRHNGYRPVEVYYVDGRYYDRWDRSFRGAQRVIVYERAGRLYRDWDDRADRYGRPQYERNDRYDDRNDRRDDQSDRRKDRRDDRSDRSRAGELKRNRDWS